VSALHAGLFFGLLLLIWVLCWLQSHDIPAWEALAVVVAVALVLGLLWSVTYLVAEVITQAQRSDQQAPEWAK
jgi:predicted PurR-regulated permease PerM